MSLLEMQSLPLLPSLPSEVWLIIFEYTIGYPLSKDRVADLYYYHVHPKFRTGADTWRYERVASLDFGQFNKVNNIRRSRLLHMKKLRLTCKQFARIISRPPPDYLLVTRQVYRNSNYVSSWCKGGNPSKYNQYKAIVLGILWAFFRIKFHVYVDPYLQPHMYSTQKNRYGEFSVREDYCHTIVLTPVGNFECHYDGLSLQSNVKNNYRDVDIPTNFDNLIEKCRVYYNERHLN